MSDTRLLSDDELRLTMTTYDPSTVSHRAILELIARRAAESEVPFAVGERVQVRSVKAHPRFVGVDPRDGEYAIVAYDDMVGVSIFKERIGALTLVPSAPTAAEVFAEAMRTLRLSDLTRMELTTCFRRVHPNPDAPLPASEEAS